MTRTELLHQLHTLADKSSRTETLPEQALAYAHITPDMPYYAGALQNVEHALQGGQPLSWWLEYQTYLETHTDTYKGIDRQCIYNALATVDAIVFALRHK